MEQMINLTIDNVKVSVPAGTTVLEAAKQAGINTKTEFYSAMAHRMDKAIHQGYQLFPCNYIALDNLNGTTAYAAHYTNADRQRFESYLSGQLAKITIPNKDEAFLRECMLNMYANPLRNKLAVE